MDIVAPRKTHGKSLVDLNVRRSFDLLVLAIRSGSSAHFTFLPAADTVIKPDDVLMVLGRELDLARFAGLA